MSAIRPRLKRCNACVKAWARARFWIEGALEGLVGGAIGLATLYFLFRMGAPRIEAMLGGVLGGIHLYFPRAASLALALGGCATVGLCGSHFALRRHLIA